MDTFLKRPSTVFPFLFPPPSPEVIPPLKALQKNNGRKYEPHTNGSLLFFFFSSTLVRSSARGVRDKRREEGEKSTVGLIHLPSSSPLFLSFDVSHNKLAPPEAC